MTKRVRLGRIPRKKNLRSKSARRAAETRREELAKDRKAPTVKHLVVEVVNVEEREEAKKTVNRVKWCGKRNLTKKKPIILRTHQKKMVKRIRTRSLMIKKSLCLKIPKHKQWPSKFSTSKNLSKMRKKRMMLRRRKRRRYLNPRKIQKLKISKHLNSHQVSILKWWWVCKVQTRSWWCNQVRCQRRQDKWLLSSNTSISSKSSICSSRLSTNTTNYYSIKRWCKLNPLEVRCNQDQQVKAVLKHLTCRCYQIQWCSVKAWLLLVAGHLNNLLALSNQHPKVTTHQTNRDEEAVSSHSPRLVTFWQTNCSIWTTVSKSFHTWFKTINTSDESHF